MRPVRMPGIRIVGTILILRLMFEIKGGWYPKILSRKSEFGIHYTHSGVRYRGKNEYDSHLGIGCGSESQKT